MQAARADRKRRAQDNGRESDGRARVKRGGFQGASRSCHQLDFGVPPPRLLGIAPLRLLRFTLARFVGRYVSNSTIRPEWSVSRSLRKM